MVAKETVKMRDCRMEKLDEAEELKEYTQHMKWFDECSSGSFVNWYKNKEDLGDDEKKVFTAHLGQYDIDKTENALWYQVYMVSFQNTL